MRLTIFESKDRDLVFKQLDSISKSYFQQHKRSAPDMFVGIQTKAVKGSPDIWTLTVDGDKQEIDNVRNIGKL